MNLLRLALFSCIALLPACGFAQVAAETPQFIFDGRNCSLCHEKPSESAIKYGAPSTVRFTEWTHWEGKDKHTTAFKMLSGERGQRMGQLLGKDVLKSEAGCIQCHTENVDESRWSKECFLPDGSNDCQLHGVACQACHGAAESWVQIHWREPWKTMTAVEKQATGFVLLEDSSTRAEKCLSCHLGSAAQSRVITHEMYAAGHPPLSGFEMESFADKMPRHWRYQNEKQAGGKFQFERTRGVLVGSVVALRMAIQLADDGSEHGPDLARLECFSCHHELRTPSWRQEGHAERSPGRPRLDLGCLPLLQATTQMARGDSGVSEFNKLIERSRQPFQQNIFGDPAAISALRREVDAWIVNMEKQLAAMPLDQAQVREVLQTLLEVASDGKHDYDTARQLTGAIIVIADELHRSGVRDAWLTELLGQLRKWSETGFALAANEDKQVEDRLQDQLEARALVFKPAVYMQAMSAMHDRAKQAAP
jgi:hypothetical protein